MPGETCPTGSSAIARLAFYEGGPCPNGYDGMLFFADHSRSCIWAMHKGSNGLPDPSQVETFIAGAANPVDLETGPNGDLFYVDFDGGTIHRIVFGGSNLAPTAVSKATPSSGPSPLTVALDATDSTDPEGRALTYSWDTRRQRRVRRFDIGLPDGGSSTRPSASPPRRRSRWGARSAFSSWSDGGAWPIPSSRVPGWPATLGRLAASGRYG